MGGSLRSGFFAQLIFNRACGMSAGGGGGG